MRTFLNILICICYTQGFGQDVNPNIVTQPNTSPTTEYSLIDDFKGLDFDKKDATVSFYFVEDDTSGIIGGLDFKISFNPNDPENATFKGTALVKTLDTDNFLRDGHLMWQKFFYKKKISQHYFRQHPGRCF